MLFTVLVLRLICLQLGVVLLDLALAFELCSREAQQILGGIGYQRGGTHPGARIEQISRDIRVITVGGGSAEVLESLSVRLEKKKSDFAASRL